MAQALVQPQVLPGLLDDLVKRLAGGRTAVVLSGDGLLLGRSAALDRGSAEQVRVMASAFQSLSRGVGTRFGKGLVLQTVVELENGYLVVTGTMTTVALESGWITISPHLVLCL